MIPLQGYKRLHLVADTSAAADATEATVSETEETQTHIELELTEHADNKAGHTV
jgi:hypothetical protein